MIKFRAWNDVMNIHTMFGHTTSLTNALITSECSSSLRFPVGTIVAIRSALPTMMVFTTMMRPKTRTAAIKIGAICSRHSGKCFVAVLTSKCRFFANVKPFFLGNAFALTTLGAKALSYKCRPFRSIDGCKTFATIGTDMRDLSACLRTSLIMAFAGAIDTLSFSGIKKDSSAGRTSIPDARDRSSHFHTSDSMSRFLKWGAFPGKNACRQVAILPKP